MPQKPIVVRPEDLEPVTVTPDQISASPGSTYTPEPEKKSLMGFAGNIIPSAMQTAGNMLQLLNPSTYANMGRVGMGAIQSALGTESQDMVPYYDALKEGIKDRYGNFGDTLYRDPVGALLDVSGALSGGGALLRGASRIAGASSVAPKLARAGEIAQTASKFTNPIDMAIGGAKAATKPAAATVVGGLGLTTGRGKAIKDLLETSDVKASIPQAGGQAIEMPRAVAAMRGQISEFDTLENLKAAMGQAKNKRLNEYQTKLAAIQQQHGGMDMTPSLNRVRQNFENKLNEFWIRRVPNEPVQPAAVAPGNPGYQNYVSQMQQYQSDLANWMSRYQGRNAGDLLFEGSGIAPTSEAGAKILEMDKMLRNWDSYTPEHTKLLGMDLLKRRMDDMYSESSRARSIVEGVKADLRKELNQSVPGYEDMTRGYADSSKFIEQLQREFSLNNQNPGVGVRKLANALNQPNDWRKSLIMDLENVQPGLGRQIIAEIAGHHMQGWMPSGIMGPMSGMGIVYSLLHGMPPKNFSILPMASPRLVGEGLMGLNPILQGAGKVGGAVRSTVANPGLQILARASGLDPTEVEAAMETGPIDPNMVVPMPTGKDYSWTPGNLSPIKK